MLAARTTSDLFGVMGQDGRQGSPLGTVDAIHAKYGASTVRMLARLPAKRRGKPRLFNYPLFEAN